MSELLWANLRAPQLRKLADEDAIVLVPVGSTEQHGPHLPVQVDALTSGEICLRAARLVSKEQPVVVTPTVVGQDWPNTTWISAARSLSISIRSAHCSPASASR